MSKEDQKFKSKISKFYIKNVKENQKFKSKMSKKY